MPIKPTDPSLLSRLAIVGEAIHGPDWQSPTARALGPHHPSMPRARLTDRAVRYWVHGTRGVPAWVAPALPVLLRDAVARRRAEIARLEELLAEETARAA